MSKYTIVYTETTLTGSCQYMSVRVRRVEARENETFKEMLEREELDNIQVVFEGHPECV